MPKIRKIYAKNMQETRNKDNMQYMCKISARYIPKICKIYAKYMKKYAQYAKKYAQLEYIKNMQKICRICKKYAKNMQQA